MKTRFYSSIILFYFISAFSGVFADDSVPGTVVVAVVDSGVDLAHPWLRIHRNAVELAHGPNGIDDDGNGFVDDFSGWNFESNNNMPFQRLRFPQETGDFKDRYDNLEARKVDLGDVFGILWDVLTNERLIASFTRYAGYSHGTHVAGIIQNQHPEAEILPIKILLGDRITLGPNVVTLTHGSRVRVPWERVLRAHVQDAAEQFAAIIHLARSQGARVLNGSYGTTAALMEPDIKALYKLFYDEDRTGDELEEDSRNLTQMYGQALGALIRGQPEILFVFAAGNEDTNNDENPHFPSSIRASNLIAVASGFAGQLHFFSNYGRNSVDIIANGKGVESTVPDNDSGYFSGTSMAAPRVSGVAVAV